MLDARLPVHTVRVLPQQVLEDPVRRGIRLVAEVFVHLFGDVSRPQVHDLFLGSEGVGGRWVTLVDRVLLEGLFDAFILVAGEAEATEELVFCAVFAAAGDGGVVCVIGTLYGSFLVNNHL